MFGYALNKRGFTVKKNRRGRVFTGRQAIKLKLIDQLGDEQAAIAWLAKEKGIDPKTPVRDYSLRPRFSEFSFIHLSAVSLLNAVGLKPLPAGRAYQLWWIRDGNPVPSVTFDIEPGGTALVKGVSVPTDGELSAAAVTEEPAGGSQQPTSPILLAGALPSGKNAVSGVR